MAADLVTDTGSHSVLRLRYRECWDAYQRIAFENAEVFKSGRKPPDDQLLAETEAAAAVHKAREALLAAIQATASDPRVATE